MPMVLMIALLAVCSNDHAVGTHGDMISKKSIAEGAVVADDADDVDEIAEIR